MGRMFFTPAVRALLASIWSICGWMSVARTSPSGPTRLAMRRLV